jgi:RNA polymerase sigma-70 factor (sigma-E family)
MGVTAEQEFDEFAVAAWPRLRRSAYLLTGDHHLAEDLAQTALARTYASWQRVRRSDALAYARKILVNANIDRMRRRRAAEVGGPAADARLATEAAPGATGEDLASDRDELVRLLAGLTERERRVVVLRHYFDLSEAEVARELGIAPGTVKSALSRALGKLRVTATEDETAFVREGLR